MSFFKTITANFVESAWNLLFPIASYNKIEIMQSYAALEINTY
jgi:hypothetical protein